MGYSDIRRYLWPISTIIEQKTIIHFLNDKYFFPTMYFAFYIFDTIYYVLFSQWRLTSEIFL